MPGGSTALSVPLDSLQPAWSLTGGNLLDTFFEEMTLQSGEPSLASEKPAERKREKRFSEVGAEGEGRSPVVLVAGKRGRNRRRTGRG